MRTLVQFAIYVSAAFFALQVQTASAEKITSLKHGRDWYVFCKNAEFTDVRRGIMLSGRSSSFGEQIYMNLEWVNWISENLGVSGDLNVANVELDLFTENIMELDIKHGFEDYPVYRFLVFPHELRADGDGLGGSVSLIANDLPVPIEWRNCWFRGLFSPSIEISDYLK